MSKKYKLAFIGGGYMAGAIISGIRRSKILSDGEILVIDVSAEARNKYEGVLAVSAQLKDVIDAEFVFFAVKPQNLASVFEEIKSCGIKKAITICAGVKKSRYKETLGDIPVARCMPNAPCAVGSGTLAVDVSDYTCEADKAFIMRVFGGVGKAIELPEEQIEAVTAISGSGPAYVYLFIKSMLDGGISLGLDKDTAFDLTIGTLRGACDMVSADTDFDDLIKKVCSKGGTTERAMQVFSDEHFEQTTKSAIKACYDRAVELSKDC